MRLGKAVFLGLVVAVAVAAFAIGAGSKSSKDVVLCAAKKGGDLTLASKGKCAKGEKKLTIAKQGPAGAVGPQGAVGPAGAPPALEALHLVAPKNSACQSNPGSFCVNPNGTCYSMANADGGLAPVSFRKDSDGFVHIEGAFQNLSGGGACGEDPTRPVFYLPQGFRPAAGETQRFTVAACTTTGSGLVTVGSNGLVSGSGGCLDLSGIVLFADA